MKLSLGTKLFLAFMVAAASYVLYHLSVNQAFPNWKVILFWVLLAIVTESLGITLPNGVGVSVNFAVVLASIVADGPLTATIASAAGFMFRILKLKDNRYAHLFNTAPYKTIFNTAQGIVSTGVAGIAFLAVEGAAGEFSLAKTLIIIPIYVFLNSTLIAKMVSLLSKQKFIGIWTNTIKGTLLSSMAVGTVGIIIALAYLFKGGVAVLLFFAPLLLARFSFKLYVDMRNTYIETIQAFNRFLEAKDSYTSGHAMRVRDYAVQLATVLELPEIKVKNIEKAAILHDIGKIGIDDSILKKPLQLTKIEYEQIQRHPIIGAEMLKDVDFLKDITDIIRHHHERYDGKGYPDGLKGEDIPIEASILAIADVYDAMTSNRPYRNSLGKEKALDEIRVNAGSQFDPRLATKFVELMSA